MKCLNVKPVLLVPVPLVSYFGSGAFSLSGCGLFAVIAGASLTIPAPCLFISLEIHLLHSLYNIIVNTGGCISLVPTLALSSVEAIGIITLISMLCSVFE